ncbi:MAG TPA: type II and III secretion system protein family protein [Stellaceae bacterium]|nr:type II and III secretion system protein family protein [Stellaceae bacterium]
MNRRSRIVRTIAMILVIAITAFAVPEIRAAQVIVPTGAPILLDVSKGVIIRLDRPCSSVFVADPDIADVQLKSPTVLYLMGKGAGETTVYAVDQSDSVLLDSRVEVRQDIDRLQREIHQIDPSDHVRAEAVDDSIVLTGSVRDAAEGDDIRKIAARYVASPSQLVNKLTLDAPNQIDLQVKVAEVQRSVLKQFGINWWNAQQGGTAAFGMVNAEQAIIPTAAFAQSSGTNVTKIVPTLPGSALDGSNLSNCCAFNTQTPTQIGNGINNNLFAGLHHGDLTINALVDALAQNGLITILAEPDLVTVSGQKASFLAGGEFPVPVPQTGTGTTAAITIDWKQFGVSLNFTPTILADGRIALHVAPEVSELAPNEGITVQGVTVPGITTRRADTTVELGSGQTFAIAGLLQNATQQQLQAYPWIGDLPIIGALFRSTAFQRGETEVVILITPYMVKPVSSATALKTDNDGFYAPSDQQRVLDGNLNTLPSQNDPAPAKPTASAPPGPAASADGGAPTPAPRASVATPVALPAPAASAATTAVEATAMPAATAAPAAPPPAPAPAAIVAAEPQPVTPTPARPSPTPAAAMAAPMRAPAASGFEID